MARRILITGATGFVGRAVLAQMLREGMKARVAVRRDGLPWPEDVETVRVSDISETADWRPAVAGIDTVLHCAARVHVMDDRTADPLAAFRSVNVGGTIALAKAARQAGARRFVFISSIGVNGAETTERPFTAEDTPAPHSPYARSKHEAEVALRELSEATGLEVVIIRPPLVVGPGAPGNFGRLVSAVSKGIPLPFGSLNNRRSFVALGNLSSLVCRCVDHPNAANRTFMVSDGTDISTTDLLRQVAAGLSRPARLIPIPGRVLRTVAGWLGKADAAQRLCGSLQVDISKTRSLLDWSPPVPLAEALREAARQHFAAASR